MRRQNRNKLRSCIQGLGKFRSFTYGSGKKRIILGVTGSFGSGKTTVAKIFKSFGVRVINADKIAHRVIRPGSKIYKGLVNALGENILKKDKTIDRDKLAKIVFNNKDLLKRLNRMIHPEVIRIIKNQIKTLSKKVIVLDAPLLIEAGLRKLVDKLIVVKTTRKNQFTRILNKKSLSKIDILKRINAQIPLKYKVRIADFVIDNSGTINNTRKQVIRIWKKLQPRKTELKV